VKPFVGQVVQYQYKPGHIPLAAIVTVVHEPSDGKDWVALHLFNEVPRLLPHVEYAIHCKNAEPPAAPAPVEEHPNTGFNGLPWGFHP
jgi:hypothetical protein